MRMLTCRVAGLFAGCCPHRCRWDEIAKTKVLKEHAEIESFLGSLRSRDVLAFLRSGCAIQEEDVGASAAVAVRVNQRRRPGIRPSMVSIAGYRVLLVAYTCACACAA
jgi:hypothetical protein